VLELEILAAGMGIEPRANMGTAAAQSIELKDIEVSSIEQLHSVCGTYLHKTDEWRFPEV